MDKELIDNLFSEKDRLSDNIRTFYEKFIYFKDTFKPQILLVSANNSSKNKIDPYFDKSNDEYDIKSYTSEDLEKNLDEVIFSDCIIVNTTALKIAPETLYKVCNFASKFHKKTYVLLDGWNGIKSTTEKVNAKIQEVQDTLHFMDFVNIFPVRKSINCEGLFEFEDAISQLIDNIKIKFEFARNEQENSIYNYAKMLVQKELDDLDNLLYKEINIVYELKNILISKQNGYRIELKNASVALSNIFNDVYNFFKDKLSHSFSNYFTYEEYNSESFDTLSINIKKKIINQVTAFFKNYITEPENIIKAKMGNLKSSCTKQLNELTLPLSQINSLPKEDFDNLNEKINDTAIFDDYQDALLEIYKTEINDISNTISDKINMIYFDKSNITSTDKINQLLQNLRSSLSAKKDNLSIDNETPELHDDNSHNTENVSSETDTNDQEIEDVAKDIIQEVTEDSKEKKFNPQDFCDYFILQATSIGIKYSNDLMYNANSKIKESSNNYVQKYFVEILHSVDEIINKLTKIQESARNIL